MGSLRRRGGVWWIRYSRAGRRHEESSRSPYKSVAVSLLRLREGDLAKGLPVSAQLHRVLFDDAARHLIDEYRTNRRRSVDELERRLEKHLLPFFGGRRLASITTADVRRYIAGRQAATESVTRAHAMRLRTGTVVPIPERRRAISGASAAEINRELTTLKRLLRLAQQAGLLAVPPHVPLLQERNTRTGFFEADAFLAVRDHLPAPLRPVVEFAYITGWRIDSEVLPLQWRHVDFTGGEIRLDPHTTKNREGRVFPMTDDLRRLLEDRLHEHRRWTAAGHVVPWVFVRAVAQGRGGPAVPRPITRFEKTWAKACREAGCPGRIPHDLRRTAVRNMVRRGVPERVAMQLTGHKTRSIFERYNIVSEGDLRSAVVQLRGLIPREAQAEQPTRPNAGTAP